MLKVVIIAEDLTGEIEAGVAVSLARRDMLILTKAGGSGSRDTLIRRRQFIHSLCD